MWLLNHIKAPATSVDTTKTGGRIWNKLIPLALMAVISLSADRRPKAMSVAQRTAIGTDRAIIQAKFKNMNSTITLKAKPLLSNFPSSLNSKFRINNKLITANPKRKGPKCSRIVYLDNINVISHHLLNTVPVRWAS